MPYVITEPCVGTKDKSCVDVCSVDCIHGTDSALQLYIDPEVCIDCGACVSACPVAAIYADAGQVEALCGHQRGLLQVTPLHAS